MAHQGILQIDRTDPLAAGLDQVLGAVGDLHVALGVDGGDVAGPQPAVVGPLVAELVRIVIGGGDPGPARLQLAHGLAVPRHQSGVVHQPHVDKGQGGPLLRAVVVLGVLVQPLHGRLEHRGSAERRHLGHAPGVNGADPVTVEAPDHRLARRRPTDGGAECRVERPALRLGIERLEDAVPDRRHTGGECDPLALAEVEQAHWVEMRARQHDAGTGRHGAE